MKTGLHSVRPEQHRDSFVRVEQQLGDLLVALGMLALSTSRSLEAGNLNPFPPLGAARAGPRRLLRTLQGLSQPIGIFGAAGGVVDLKRWPIVIAIACYYMLLE